MFTSSAWRTNNYRAFLTAKNYIDASDALQQAGYATSPNYAVTLQRLIRMHSLNELDEASVSENNTSTLTRTTTDIVVTNTVAKPNITRQGLLMLNEHNEWVYLDNGQFNPLFTGIVQHQENKAWFYVENGKINWHFSGLAQNATTKEYMYVQNGHVNEQFTGLIQHQTSYEWMYVENGRVNERFSGLVQHQVNKAWFYVEKGKINWSYVGVVQHHINRAWFYVENGKINWNFNSNYVKDNVPYKIANGVVTNDSKLEQPKRVSTEFSKVIFIDPGHGGKDGGAYYYGVKESDVALDVSKKLKTLLHEAGYSVIMTREDDTYVDFKTDRSRMVNDTNSDMFISIHFNASGRGEGWSSQGVETYWYEYDQKYPPKINQEFHNDPLRLRNSEILATALHNSVLQESAAKNRGILRDTLAVLRETAKPAALIELGFMDNYDENQKIRLETYRQLLAEGFFKGIKNYYNVLSTLQEK